MTVSLLVGTAKGAFRYRSDDRRAWRLDGPFFKGWRVTAFGADGAGGYLAATASPVYGPAVHRSADLAEWRQVERSPAYTKASGFELEEVWRFAAGPDALFAGVAQAGLFKSTDHGESWDLVEGLTAHPTRPRWFPGFGGLCAHAIVADPADPARLWTGISAVGVFRSEDGGVTWTPRNEGVPVIIEDETDKAIGRCVHALVPDPDDPRRIWRQDHRGMFRTADGGDTWERIEQGLPSGFGFPLVLDRRTKTLFAFPLESDEYRLPVEGRFRVYRSADGGDSWHALDDGLPREPCYDGVLRAAMCADQLDPGGVYLGTTSGSVWASADLGDAWQRLPGTLPRVLTVHAVADGA